MTSLLVSNLSIFPKRENRNITELKYEVLMNTSVNEVATQTNKIPDNFYEVGDLKGSKPDNYI
jgi:hypothetical protein